MPARRSAEGRLIYLLRGGASMQTMMQVILLACATLYMGAVAGQGFPPAPPDVSAAEAAGLRRIDAAELKQNYPGKRIAQSNRGLTVMTNLKADGTIEYSDSAGGTDTGTWSVSERNGGSICRAYSKQM